MYVEAQETFLDVTMGTFYFSSDLDIARIDMVSNAIDAMQVPDSILLVELSCQH